MNLIKLVTIAVLVFSVAIGSAFGLLIPSDQPQGQVYSFGSFAVHTSNPSQCYPDPKNYSSWVGIEVLGNRTGMNFQSLNVYSAGYNIKIDLPLNRTSFATIKPTNSSFETIYVPLPNYFNAGDVIQMSITFFISGYPPSSAALPEAPILDGQLHC